MVRSALLFGNCQICFSGARLEILKQCPGDLAQFKSPGWAILITSGMPPSPCGSRGCH
jgi:hypothetical protein